MKVTHFFKISRTVYPAMQHHIPEHRNPKNCFFLKENTVFLNMQVWKWSITHAVWEMDSVSFGNKEFLY